MRALEQSWMYIRRKAFFKLAALSHQSRDGSSANEGFDRLTHAIGKSAPQANGFLDGIFKGIAPSSRVPMDIRELDIVLALCTAEPSRLDHDNATRLLEQAGEYLPESHTQLFAPSPFLHDIKPSPWEALTYNLTTALLGLGTTHTSLSGTVKMRIDSYISNCTRSINAVPSLQDSQNDSTEDSEIQQAAEVVAIAVSLIGFLRAIGNHAKFWSLEERLQLIRQLRTMLSDRFLTTVETAASWIRSSAGPGSTLHSWKRYMRRYAAQGQPIGAMLLQQGFMDFVLASVTPLVTTSSTKPQRPLLRQHISGLTLMRAPDEDIQDDMIEYLVDVISDELKVLEEGSDYLQIGSTWQQRLALSLKASALEAFLYCMIIDEDIADADILYSWLEDTLANPVQMSNERLATIVSQCLSVIAKYIPESATNLARIILRFLVQNTSQKFAVEVAAESLGRILRSLSQDAMITTLYSLGNVLSSSSGTEKSHHVPSSSTVDGHLNHRGSSPYNSADGAGSMISLSATGDEETSNVCSNVARAIVIVARGCDDERIIALAQAVMLQKIGKINLEIDAYIIEEVAALAVAGRESEFKALLKFLARAEADSQMRQTSIISDAILRARVYIAKNVDSSSPLYRVYLMELLQGMITKGDIMTEEKKREKSTPDVDSASRDIMALVRPLAILLSRNPIPAYDGPIDDEEEDEIQDMFREAWFNIAVHGITLGSQLGQDYYEELRIFANYTSSLVDEDRAELLESNVELNTILRRGMSTRHTEEQRLHLLKLIPSRESDIRHLSYPKIIFLNATYLVESLKAVSGSCSTILIYFLDPALQSSEMGNCLSAIGDEVVRVYLNKLLTGRFIDFSAAVASKQLARLLVGCCSRMLKVQQVAMNAADRIISQAPSVLYHKSALFALLELLTLMWTSCLESELDEHEWKSTFKSARGKITLHLSDDYAFRRRTLNSFHGQARKWVTSIICVAPLDVKGLLQTYLSEFDDTGAYGHVALGRTFAVNMGALIPPTDQRLIAVDRQTDNVPIDVASDFVAQYTTRQEYRYAEFPDHEQVWSASTQSDGDHTFKARSKGEGVAEEAKAILADIASRTEDGKFVSIAEIRHDLRRAAALLCRSKISQSAVVHRLVTIPFGAFTKASIKFGISMWLGVINENPRMESRILTEVAMEWEKTIDRRLGIFSDKFGQKDPFYIKEEFAPSEKSILMRQQQAASDTISPHLRLLQFFESHFNAIRLGSTNTQRTFVGMIAKTLYGLQLSRGHPLTREIHFHTILFALQILRWSTVLTRVVQWTLKDAIISAGLSWFKHTPSWSFGGNRLQVKSEIQLMTDIQVALQSTQGIGRGETPNRQSLQQRQTLLHLLLESEKARLSVWLYPLEHENRHGSVSESAISPLIGLAWSEHPELAVSMATRFSSDTIKREVRSLIIKSPEKATTDADALDLLLGPELPHDVTYQLKYLLYWAPVNPMQAVTYFLPAYGNHPFILQYAMRALESHSVDVTFFYVPQIVQALRYDALGYVEQYIIETGKFSQLFAHQIIWNMKANAFKDEDSQIPDPLKPTLDKVMDSLISSFSGEDKDFYEREFAFFNEVTDISGKLRPFIKKSKPEKKAKIEEELRKIQVEVGVYLPSNPDGVVVGIDRKSGKPLQSHAKAPYMATFRIRKARNEGTEAIGQLVEKAPKDERQHLRNAASIGSSNDISIRRETQAETYEVWQSAIFKVGDDCRQDVLALQMIAAFRGIFNNCGLDVYVFPYRVTATAPGCGVIDVLPNSISRDMLGREAVNGLYDYFVAKYGGEHSIQFQEARANFVKSMAAYSVITYLLQFKDRHNGNIMVDDAGHILHIDFGFCFDIAPGGVKFERAPFKLTNEMISVMGGSTSSQSYRWFEELTVKAFLATRPYAEKLCHIVSVMLDSGLPCFKPQTINNLRDRFVLEKSEREAAVFMRGLVRKSEGALSTKGYDQFQLMTNGIPY